MNIAIMMSHIAGKGGVETVIETMLANQFSVKHHLTLIFPDVNDGNIAWITQLKSCYEYKVNFIIATEEESIQRFKRLLFIYRALTKFRYDCVIDLSVKTTKFEQMVRKISRNDYKIISWLHNIYYQSSIEQYGKYPDAYLAISTGLEKINEWGAIDPSKIKLIYNPVVKRAVLPLSKVSKVKFVYVGRIDEKQKNFSEMFEAFADIDSSTYELYLYGDGPDRQQIEEMAHSKQVNAIFHGWKNDPWREIQQKGINYLILTSKYEGFGMVLTEAIARGIPVISSDCVAGPADIVNKDNGFLYTLNDVEQLREVIKQCQAMRNNWNQERVQQSINFLYEKAYIERLNKALNEIIDI